jgi:hypothetical protein
LDILSTFFAGWRGIPIQLYESGLFASYFAQRGLIHIYIFIYLGILFGMAGTLLFIKHEVSSNKFFDELVLFLLVVTICLIEAVLVNTILANFLLGVNPRIILGVSQSLRWLVYTSVIIIIVVYSWGELRDLFGFV